MAPDRLLVRPGGPGGLAVLELERDIGDLKTQIGNGPIKSDGALRGRLARAHDHISRRDVRHELAVFHVLRVNDAIVRLCGAAFQLAHEPRAVRRAHLDLGVLREERREFLSLAGDRVEVDRTRTEDHVPPRIEFEAVRPRPLAAHISQEDSRAPKACPFGAAVPVRVVRGRGLRFLHVLAVPCDVCGAREEDVGIRLRESGPFRGGNLSQLRGREVLHGSPVRFLVLQEEHRPGADRAQLIHDLLRGVEPVVPALDDHVLLWLDLQASTDDVLRERFVIGHGIAGAAEVGPRINRYARGGAKGLSTAHRSGRPGGDSSEPRETVSPPERLTLRHLADALVPSVPVESDPDGFYARRASDLAVDDDVARIIERYISPNQRADFRRLLRTIESPCANLLLSGRPHRFSAGTQAERERFLLAWAHSRLGIKRQGFHAVKRLVLFLTYAKALESGVNPNWPAIGYAAPHPRASPAAPEPSEFSIESVRPANETSLEADVCVVGTGAGGSVLAAKLAEAGYRGIVLEAGPGRPRGALPAREAGGADTKLRGPR